MFTSTKRLIVIICVVAAALIGANLSFLHLGAKRADSDQNDRNRRLVESFIEAYADNFLAHLSGLSTSSSTFNSLYDGSFTKDFARTCRNGRIASDVAFLALADGAGQLKFVCEYGQLKDLTGHSDIMRKVVPKISQLDAQVGEVQQRYGLIAPEFNFDKSFTAVGDRAYLTIVSVINPQDVTAVFDGYKPVYLISLVNVENVMVDDAKQSLPVAGLGFQSGAATQPGFDGFPVQNSAGETIAVVRWQSSNEFQSLLLSLLPTVVGVSLLSLLVIFWSLMKISRLQSVISHQEAEARHAASHDAMTGLANRARFNQLMESAAAAVAAGSSRHIGFFDLDYFKQVNDTYGHDIGDELLIAIASRLEAVMGVDHVAARLGGDEFAMIIDGDKIDGPVEAFCDGLLKDVMRPIQTSNTEIVPSASLGVAQFVRYVDTTMTVLKAADEALYDAKEAGRGCYRIFDRLAKLQEIRDQMNDVADDTNYESLRKAN